MVIAQEGDSEQGVVIGAVWSAVDQPPVAAAGEFWLVHPSGSYLKLQNDGSIAMQAPVVNIGGNLVVSGDISDYSGARGTLNNLRGVYDTHKHNSPQGGVTSQPLETL
jgi:phage baseplate assembly protein gpV